MVIFGVVMAIMIEGVLTHFNLLVTGDELIQEVIKPVLRAPPELIQKLLLLSWKILTIAVEYPFGMICVIFMPDIPAGFVKHIYHFRVLAWYYNNYSLPSDAGEFC
jgi:hypothetical protein